MIKSTHASQTRVVVLSTRIEITFHQWQSVNTILYSPNLEGRLAPVPEILNLSYLQRQAWNQVTSSEFDMDDHAPNIAEALLTAEPNRMQPPENSNRPESRPVIYPASAFAEPTGYIPARAVYESGDEAPSEISEGHLEQIGVVNGAVIPPRPIRRTGIPTIDNANLQPVQSPPRRPYGMNQLSWESSRSGAATAEPPSSEAKAAAKAPPHPSITPGLRILDYLDQRELQTHSYQTIGCKKPWPEGSNGFNNRMLLSQTKFQPVKTLLALWKIS